MSSKGRKIAKNLGKSIRKKFDSDSQTDDLQQASAELTPPFESAPHHHSASGDMKSSSSASPPSIAKSTSLSTIGNDPTADPVVVDHSEILALTHDVKNFSDTLAKLKVLFIEGLDTGDDARVVLQNSLGEVLAVLKNTMQRYQDLKTPEIFTAARVLINKIKAHDSEELQLDEEELQFYLDAIDQVALAFSRSVSEYLMGDMVTQQHLNSDTKVQSCDNLAKAAPHEEKVPEKQEPRKMLTPEELDAVLVGLEAGLDLALQRAKAWSRYTRDIMSYIEKKSQLEMEYAKNLARIAHGMQPVLTSEGFLPLQSVFCTALSQDAEFASNLQASQALLHTSKFVEPLASRRNEHDRARKSVKETWDRELRRMQDTVNNLRKAQALYISRQQELERVRETLQKAEGDKMEKRKKSEEEAMHKSAEAETTYKACVAEANHRQRSLEKTKVELLGRVREQILQCDQVIKMVTVDYFNLLHTVWSPVPVQYQTLCESSSGYEPGCQYAEFIKRLPSSASRPSRTDEFAFEAYTPGQKAGEARKISVHSNGSSGDHIHSNEGSPVSSPRRDKYRIPVKAWGQNSSQMLAAGGSDTDSASGSNKSHESSPSSSPHDLLRRQIVSAQSLEELAEEDMDKLHAAAHQKRSHMKRTMTVGEDSLELPGIMNQQGRRNTMFGVDFQEQVEHYKSQVPPIVTKCLAEIERRGVMIKGIYRVSGVKSKVESLCQRFDLNPELVDLEEVHPNIISNVLKLYLRQLPEPLLSFRLYSDFIHLAKENMSGCLVGDRMIERLSALVRKLPTSNFRTCAVLMHHLHRVAGHSDLNHMSCSNLGIVFGPTLLRPLEGTASLASLVDTPHQTRAVELLITNAEAVFGPGDDYQLVPDQTPVEALEAASDDLSNTVPSSSSEPSPERSPTKDVMDGFPTPAPLASPALLPASTAGTSTVPATVVSQSDDSAALVTDAAPITPGPEPSATDFSLPGSASLDKYDNVFVSSPGGTVVDGQPLSMNSDGSSLSTLDDEDDVDDLGDVMLPDQSSAPDSQSHTPFLTPHCMAESQSVVRTGAAGKAGGGSSNLRTGYPPTAPLADMDPAPDTTLPSSITAVVDSSTWPGPVGRGSASLPASPTIKPLHTSSSSAGSVMSDGRLSPTKSPDNRADRFKVEQRKLLSAIKSDPKLGIAVDQSPTPSTTSDPRQSTSSREGEGAPGNDGDLEGDRLEDVKVESAPVFVTGNEEVHPPSLLQTVVAVESLPPPAASVSVLDQRALGQSKTVSGESLSEVFVTEKKEDTGVVVLTQKTGSAAVTVEKTEAKSRKIERSSSGSKLLGNTDTAPGRSGIRLGMGGSSPRLDSSSSSSAPRASPMGVGVKYSATSKTRPSTVSIGQRRSNITGLSSPTTALPTARGTTSSPTGPSSSRSALSRYPSSSTTPPSSTSPRRPTTTSLPPSSTALSRSSAPGVGRRTMGYSSSPDSSPRAPSSSTSSDSSPASLGAGARARRTSGEKSPRESGALSRGASGNGSVGKSSTGGRSGLSSARNTAGNGGKSLSSASRSGTNGASKGCSAMSATSTAVVGTGKMGTSLSCVASSLTTKTVTSITSDSGMATSSASGQFHEKGQDQKPADPSSFSSGAKDLSSDRTPRFV
ncbi:uncharacterized protein LOC143279954 isoform X2 [Babylonia areolata]|uniref:uncharacterized protein LOC143279954 isoform X2 n=1 Tax=Babylonia areolata TaxID=304850 RepID=UPI003FD0FBD6